MPVYEYQCESCGIVFEAIQKFSDAPLTQWKSCCSGVKKLISQSGFALKGGGWYQQGYSGPSANSCPSAAPSGGCAGCAKAAND